MATELAALLGPLQELCRLLKLPTVLRNAATLDEAARRKGQEPLAYLVDLLSLEVDERQDRSSQRRIKEAGFPVVKTLAGFDFSRNPTLPEALLRQLAGCRFIEQAEPIVLLGEPGTGKTHLACAIGVAAARMGHSVRFVTAARLVTELVEAKDSRELNRVVTRYARVDLLILDELAYVPLATGDAELLFRVLGERQERRPIIVTTNLTFGEWTKMFPDPRLCRAIVDRLTHRAHIIDTGEDSERLKETMRRIAARKLADGAPAHKPA
jgi:DNA replication protein DnaC